MARPLFFVVAFPPTQRKTEKAVWPRKTSEEQPNSASLDPTTSSHQLLKYGTTYLNQQFKEESEYIILDIAILS